MSRIGKLPVVIPAGVTITVSSDNLVSVNGPKGALQQQINSSMILKQDAGVLTVERPSDNKQHRAFHGLSRTLINNMVVGVSSGYSKTLEIVGVGYKAAKNGKTLVLSLGYSHPVEFIEPAGITIDVPTPNTIVVNGFDKQAVGQLAAEIRAKREPEPYKGKGIKYANEIIRRKEGKTGK